MLCGVWCVVYVLMLHQTPEALNEADLVHQTPALDQGPVSPPTEPPHSHTAVRRGHLPARLPPQVDRGVWASRATQSQATQFPGNRPPAVGSQACDLSHGHA